MPRIIKRYRNRKLYDTERSCYVTLDEIALMVKAGDQVDKEISDLLPHLSAGDMIIDGGNSLFTETERRAAADQRIVTLNQCPGIARRHR